MSRRYVDLDSLENISKGLREMGEHRAADFVHSCFLLFKGKTPDDPKCSNCQHPIDITCHFCYGKPAYDPTFGDDRLCVCGHPYYRHFDTYEEMRPVGCKYCGCDTFEEAA